MKTMRPFFTYYGGKWRAAKRYPPPKYDLIVEPFAGAAGYSLRHYQKDVVLVDKDPVLAGLWDYLIHVSEKEILGLPLWQPDFDTVSDIPNICQEARHLIGFWLNKGTTSPARSPSAWQRTGKYSPGNFWGEPVKQRIASQVGYIRHWKVICGDYTAAKVSEPATYFVDPPYMRAGQHYKHGSKALDFAALASWCKSLDGQVIVCEGEGADWLPFQPYIDIKANESSRGGKVSKEYVWINDPSF